MSASGDILARSAAPWRTCGGSERSVPPECLCAEDSPTWCSNGTQQPSHGTRLLESPTKTRFRSPESLPEYADMHL